MWVLPQYLAPTMSTSDHQPAVAPRTQILNPGEHDLHDQWLQAAQDCVRPEALSTARQLVIELRGQANSTIRVGPDAKVRISGSLESFGKHIRALFAAGLIGKKGLAGDFDVFVLGLF